MPVEVGVKVTLSVKRESGETESKTIPLKDFKTPHEPGTPAFWDDVLGFVKKYYIYPDTKQKTLTSGPETGSPEAHKAADAANKSLGAKLKEEQKEKKAKKEKPATEDSPADPPAE